MEQMRKQRRSMIFNRLLLLAQRDGSLGTHDTFAAAFERLMRAELGECTEEDLAWLEEWIEHYFDGPMVTPSNPRTAEVAAKQETRTRTHRWKRGAKKKRR